MSAIEETWAARLREYEASGKSMAEFCVGKGYSKNSLSAWSRRLRGRGPGRPPQRAVAMARVVAPRSGREGVTVECDGVRVLVQAESDRELVADVLELLRRAE